MHWACCGTFKTALEIEDNAAMLMTVEMNLWNEHERVNDFRC